MDNIFDAQQPMIDSGEQGDTPRGGDFWSTQNLDLFVEKKLEEALFKTALMFYNPNEDDENIRLAIIATLQGAYNFIQKYETALPKAKDNTTLLTQIQLYINVYQSGTGMYEKMQLWYMYSSQRYAILVALGKHCGFRKQKKGVWSWTQKKTSLITKQGGSTKINAR